MISDFGLSKTEESGTMATACGTPGYVGEWCRGFNKIQTGGGVERAAQGQGEGCCADSRWRWLSERR